MKIPLAYRQGAVFGCDIGSQTVKVVQLGGTLKRPKVVAYGFAPFDPKWVAKGVIQQPEKLAAVIKQLLASPQAGRISAKRLVASVPISAVFVRTLQLPPMSKEDLKSAIELEAEQYIPIPLKDLYLDYDTLSVVGTNLDVEMVAAPRALVDSYTKLFDELGLFTESMEISQAAVMRSATYRAGDPVLLADLGSENTDLVISDRAIRLSSSIPVGGVRLTEALKTKLNITEQQAEEIKQKYGIGPSGLRERILAALKPSLDTLEREITKSMKYYHDRSGSQKSIHKIILSGGSSYMPGLLEHLTQVFRMPVAIDDPWETVDFGSLPPPPDLERAMYTTAVGLALMGLP